MFQILEVTVINVEKKTNYCLNFGLVLPIIWVKMNSSAVITLRIWEKQKAGYAKNI